MNALNLLQAGKWPLQMLPLKKLTLKFYIYLVTLLCMANAAVFAEPAQSSGGGYLKVSVGANGAQIDFHAPLLNLLGFEYVPEESEEQNQVFNAVVSRFQQAKMLFIPPAAARCQVESVSIQAPVSASEMNVDNSANQAGESAEPAAEQHMQLFAGISFRCAEPAAFNALEMRLFKVFPQLTELDATLLIADVQTRVKLSAQANILSW